MVEGGVGPTQASQRNADLQCLGCLGKFGWRSLASEGLPGAGSSKVKANSIEFEFRRFNEKDCQNFCAPEKGVFAAGQ
jgi:hypothetical protein